MFNSKLKSPDRELSTGSTTIIGAGTTITGDLESAGDIRIDGVLNGNLYGKAKIFIGQDGNVQGDIHGKQADVLGKVTGQLKIKELLQLLGKGIVDGDIYAGKLHVEPSASFNGHCHMGANIVEFNTEIGNAVNQ